MQDVGTGPVEAALTRAAWQSVLSAAQPRRSEVAGLRPSWACRSVRIAVHRNHAFEHVASALGPFLGYARLTPIFEYSDYDDSLAMESPVRADAEIVWLDYGRYAGRMTPEQLADWIAERLTARRARTDSPLLVTTWAGGGEAAESFNRRLEADVAMLPGVYVCDLVPLAEQLGARFLDRRAERLSGTSLSDAALVAAAQQFGLVWLPAVLLPPVKAVVVDLDHTLYAGVLGEEGVHGIVLSAGHEAMQRQLVALRDRGLLLAVASRNEEADVRQLFATRSDFPLRLEHLSAFEVSWGNKADALRRVLASLRIGADAVLFVDDNPGELAAVAEAVPGLWTLHASEDAAATGWALALAPGLWRWRTGEADTLRAADLAANAEREALASHSADPLEYLASLQARLTFEVNPEAQRDRLQELSVKTNQFNLGLARFNASEVDRRLHDPDCPIVTIRLADRLADSGIVGAAFGRREGDILIVDELCISCRALGRRLEDVMIGEAISLMLATTPAARVGFHYARGPRNAPAREWLERFAGTPLKGDEGLLAIEWSSSAHRERVSLLPVTLIHGDAHAA